MNFVVIMKLEKKGFHGKLTLNDLFSNASAASEIKVKMVTLALRNENVKEAGMEEQVHLPKHVPRQISVNKGRGERRTYCLTCISFSLNILCRMIKWIRFFRH